MSEKSDNSENKTEIMDELFKNSMKKIVLFFYSRESRVFRLIEHNKKGSLFEYDGGSYTLLEPFAFWKDTSVYIVVKQEPCSIVINFNEKLKPNKNNSPLNEVFQDPEVIAKMVKHQHYKYLFGIGMSNKKLIHWLLSWLLSLILVGYIVYTICMSSVGGL